VTGRIPVRPGSKDQIVATIQAEPEPIEIDLNRTAVIVVDISNDFFSKGGTLDKLWHMDVSGNRSIIEPCKQVLEISRKKGLKIVYLYLAYRSDLSDTGGEDSPHWYKESALVAHLKDPEIIDIRDGCWNVAIIDELKPKPTDIVIRKPRYNGFTHTDLDVTLRTNNIKYLLFIGSATNLCVEGTIRQAYDLDYFCILLMDAVHHVGPGYTQEATIHNVKFCLGWVATTQDFIRGIQDA